MPRLKKIETVAGAVENATSVLILSYTMSTWSKSALKLPSVVVSDKSFPTLSVVPPPPSKKPVLSFAQKVKETVEADAAAAAIVEAKKKAEADRVSAQRVAEKRNSVPVSNFYKTHPTTDADYYHEDSSPDEMDYETALEYAEHLRFNRRERARVSDYSKDLGSSDDEHAEEATV